MVERAPLIKFTRIGSAWHQGKPDQSLARRCRRSEFWSGLFEPYHRRRSVVLLKLLQRQLRQTLTIVRAQWRLRLTSTSKRSRFSLSQPIRRATIYRNLHREMDRRQRFADRLPAGRLGSVAASIRSRAGAGGSALRPMFRRRLNFLAAMRGSLPSWASRPPAWTPPLRSSWRRRSIRCP